jgi:hypothetical protein
MIDTKQRRFVIAISIAFLAGLAGIGIAVQAIILKFRNKPDSHYWILSTLILAIPALYIVLTEL